MAIFRRRRSTTTVPLKAQGVPRSTIPADALQTTNPRLVAAQQAGFAPRPMMHPAGSSAYATALSVGNKFPAGGLTVTNPSAARIAAAKREVALLKNISKTHVAKVVAEERATTFKALRNAKQIEQMLAPRQQYVPRTSQTVDAGLQDDSRTVAEFDMAQRKAAREAISYAQAADQDEVAGNPVRAQQRRNVAMQKLSDAKNFGRRLLERKASYAKTSLIAAGVRAAESAERSGNVARGRELRQQVDRAARVQLQAPVPAALRNPLVTVSERSAFAIVQKAKENPAAVASMYGHGLGGYQAMNGLSGFFSSVTKAANDVVKETQKAVTGVTNQISTAANAAGCAALPAIQKQAQQQASSAAQSFAKGYTTGAQSKTAQANKAGTGTAGLSAYALAMIESDMASPMQKAAIGRRGYSGLGIFNCSTKPAPSKMPPPETGSGTSTTENKGGGGVGILAAIGAAALLLFR